MKFVLNILSAIVAALLLVIVGNTIDRMLSKPLDTDLDELAA